MTAIRVQVTLDADAASLLDAQPPRTGSAYLSRLVLLTHRRAYQARGYVAGIMSREEAQAALAALLGASLDHPMARSSAAVAGEMHDALEIVRDRGLGDTWPALCARVAADPLAGPALCELADAYWSGEAATVAAIDAGRGWRAR
jgi:hypothetical protein